MEQRRHRRLPAAIRVFARTGGSGFPEPAKDISICGVGVFTAAPLGVGAESIFALHLPHHDAPLELRGHVVWVNGTTMGVEFDKSDERLTSFVEKLERDATRL
jgi:hypothetical protein